MSLTDPARTRKPRRRPTAKVTAVNAAIVSAAGTDGHVLTPRQLPRIPAWRTDLVDPVMALVVYGRAAAQGSKRAVAPGVMVEQSDYVKPWRDAVRRVATRAVQQYPQRHGRRWRALDEPVLVSLVVTVPATEAAAARGDVFATGFADLDKLQRAIGDALSPIPVKPSDVKGCPPAAVKKVREEILAQRRLLSVLHDDSRIGAWDHVAKVYPATTPDSLAHPGCLIRVWRITDLEAAQSTPLRREGGRWLIRPEDLQRWARPPEGVSWSEAADRCWQAPQRVFAAADVVELRGRQLTDDGMRSALRCIAVNGPAVDMPVNLLAA